MSQQYSMTLRFHSFIQPTLIAYYLPGTVLEARDMLVNKLKKQKIPVSSVSILGGKKAGGEFRQ